MELTLQQYRISIGTYCIYAHSKHNIPTNHGKMYDKISDRNRISWLIILSLLISSLAIFSSMTFSTMFTTNVNYYAEQHYGTSSQNVHLNFLNLMPISISKSVRSVFTKKMEYHIMNSAKTLS